MKNKISIITVVYNGAATLEQTILSVINQTYKNIEHIGWSTVVEDCKTIGKHMFLSSLPVHLEQIGENVTFFDPSDEIEPAELLLKTETVEYRIHTEKELTENLKNRMLKFVNDFLSIFQWNGFPSASSCSSAVLMTFRYPFFLNPSVRTRSPVQSGASK
jgi:hypothetical protein